VRELVALHVSLHMNSFVAVIADGKPIPHQSVSFTVFPSVQSKIMTSDGLLCE